MKAKEFVQEVIALKPSSKDFDGLNYSIEFINTQIKEFEISKLSDDQYENELFNLILNYNITSLSINDISFDPEFQEDYEYYYIGYDTGPNRIVINKSSGKISAIEPYSRNLIFHCAESDETYLEALLEIMKFSKEKILSNHTEEQRYVRAAEVAYIASLKAGGEEYEDYYRAVLWLE